MIVRATLVVARVTGNPLWLPVQEPQGLPMRDPVIAYAGTTTVTHSL
jgi:hypothetical protein